MSKELCSECDEPTGRAGKHEDSIYIGSFGPFCEDCVAEQTESIVDCLECRVAELRGLRPTDAEGQAMVLGLTTLEQCGHRIGRVSASILKGYLKRNNIK